MAGRYEKKSKSLETDMIKPSVLEELFGFRMDDADEEEKLDMLHSLTFTKWVLENVDTKKGALLEYRGGNESENGGEQMVLGGFGPNILYGLMRLIIATIERFEDADKAELLSDLFSGTWVLMQYEKNKGVE